MSIKLRYEFIPDLLKNWVVLDEMIPIRKDLQPFLVRAALSHLLAGSEALVRSEDNAHYPKALFVLCKRELFSEQNLLGGLPKLFSYYASATVEGFSCTSETSRCSGRERDSVDENGFRENESQTLESL